MSANTDIQALLNKKIAQQKVTTDTPAPPSKSDRIKKAVNKVATSYYKMTLHTDSTSKAAQKDFYSELTCDNVDQSF